jgi:hypothetical protein
MDDPEMDDPEMDAPEMDAEEPAKQLHMQGGDLC